MQKQHYYASSVAEWRVATDLQQLKELMDKAGFEYGIWSVPLDISADYNIKYYRPQVEGAEFIGKYPAA